MPTEQGDATGCNRVLQQGLPFDIVGVPVLDKSELVVPLGFEKMVIMLAARDVVGNELLPIVATVPALHRGLVPPWLR